MPFNLLLLPLVGGYYLLITSRFTKYIHQRIDRQRLIFNSVLAGIVLIGLSIGFSKLIEYLEPAWFYSLKKSVPLQLPYTGTAVASLLLGILLSHLSNLFISNTRALSWSIRLIGNELEQLINGAFVEATLVSFTMKNGKVYVGWPVSLPRPSRGSYLSVLPLFSGYRNDEQDVTFTTEYWDIYHQRREAGEDDMYQGFLLVLSTDEVVSASLFDLDIYERFGQLK